jgi:hypothetical protein
MAANEVTRNDKEDINTAKPSAKCENLKMIQDD